MSDDELQKHIQQVDNNRKRYYELYTNKRWGDPSHYDLCINTSKTAIKDAVEMIVHLLKKGER